MISLLFGVPALLALVCTMQQWQWSCQRFRNKLSRPILTPLIGMWVWVIVSAILVGLCLPDSWVARLSLERIENRKAPDGWIILAVWATFFSIFYGITSLGVSGFLLWKGSKQ